jgi:DNA-binding LytR/AlgR family response regulator
MKNSSKEITILLVEDDFLNRRLVKKVLDEKGYRVLEAKNSHDAISLLCDEAIDLAILDIRLGEKEREGITLGAYISEWFTVPFIYLTAYQTIDILDKALNTVPHSYLTKPFKNADLIAAVELALKKTPDKKKLPFLILKENNYHVKVSFENIDYIESEGNYLLIHCNRKVYKFRGTVKQMLETLPMDSFIQTHRAFIVNKNKIDCFKTNSLLVKDASIPVSKNYADVLQTIYQFAG